MSLLVQKYGGSSLSDLDRLEKVAEKIISTKEDGYEVVVVVSAMGDTTDTLLEDAQQLADNPSRRELDMLLSVGERISMALLSIAIQKAGHEAVSLTGSQCGIITTHNHSNARIMDVRPYRVQDELAMGHIVIIAGYQGASYRREVTTLGRGGSDTTAVALAAALGAEACEIYSDVEGIYSADPNVAMSAEQLDDLTHSEMLEMARSGAKVLHQDAVEYARRRDIALFARKTHMPTSNGTVIRPDGFYERAERSEQHNTATAVTHIEQGLWIRAESEPDELVEALQAERMHLCNWDPENLLEAFVTTENKGATRQLERKLTQLNDDVDISRKGLVSVVGTGIGETTRWVKKGNDLLNDAGIEPTHVELQSDRLSWVVERKEVEQAVGKAHAFFVEKPEASEYPRPTFDA